MIADTSINGYKASMEKHEAQRVIILRELEKHPEGMTRRMLSRATNIETSTISARVNELIKAQVLDEPFRDKCPITNIEVKWLQIRGSDV
ncbi:MULTISPECIES: MarR family transcriptional regulator [unclassified Campylobacter]|jgi:hypothetical protein|uniref:MarR family transcriptional regulator n=1 Tax=unclassified Campylobacter TaxID=2593542 RepID=UPI00027A3861|nr:MULTISPECIES: helix-turn-helix domain-containing protein [unclassified Campylobacter]EJP74725.1 winged helix-turn-helix DNA-binding protein [Campylobacter sp. FOBRC14]MDU6827775.1 helix-turn-helix domain-containing protein [Campylobacter sp.]